MERRAKQINKNILRIVGRQLLGTQETNGNQINSVGKALFGDAFHGVYASDKIPVLTKDKPYSIINLDDSNMTGSHWVAVCKKGKNIIVYDSFGRRWQDILPSLANSGNGGSISNTKPDAEQAVKASDCGARSMAFICVLHHWGLQMARLI